MSAFGLVVLALIAIGLYQWVGALWAAAILILGAVSLFFIIVLIVACARVYEKVSKRRI